MADSKELYKLLSSDFKTENAFYFASRGEGMMLGAEKDTRRVFLINTNTQEAWELLTPDRHFSFWDKSAVEIADTFDLPDIARYNANEVRAPFCFDINDYKDGVASVIWTLQPDGRYYADEDGFGMENDVEINFTAFIDQSANILIPFQEMDESIQRQYRKQAVEISKNQEETSYICLSPKMTIPFCENYNIENHKEKLIRIISGIMIQFGAKVENAYKNSNYIEPLGVFRSINPTPNHYLSLTLIGKKIQSDQEKYEVGFVTAIFKKDYEPQCLCVYTGEYTSAEIANIMLNENNVEMIYNEFIRMVKELTQQSL